MVGIYLAIACMAVVLVAVFVDNLPKEATEKKKNLKSEVDIKRWCFILTARPVSHSANHLRLGLDILRPATLQAEPSLKLRIGMIYTKYQDNTMTTRY